MEDDCIYLSSEFTDWRWFSSTKVLQVFIWLLLEAATKTKYHCKDTIKRGSLVATNEIIAESCGLTIQNVRTALANLEKTGDIKRERRNFYQIITITDYERYKNHP